MNNSLGVVNGGWQYILSGPTVTSAPYVGKAITYILADMQLLYYDTLSTTTAGTSQMQRNLITNTTRQKSNSTLFKHSKTLLI